MIGQGFMSRLLLIFSQPTNKKIAFPKEPSIADTNWMLEALAEIRNVCQGICSLDEEATKYLEDVYVNFPKHSDYRFTHYNGRRFTHLLKICMCVAACDLSTVIEKRHAVYANTILYQAELNMPAALAEFGKSNYAEAMGRILTHLESADKPVTMGELHKLVHHDLNGGLIELQKIMYSLKDADKAQQVQGGWLAKKELGQDALAFVDMNLLEEYHGIP